MSRQITTTVYKFEELTDDAKERARQWFRECLQEDNDTEFVYDDAVRMGALLGIEFDTRYIPLMGGGKRKEPTIYYSGFSSQGDGACFEGRYSYAKGAPAAIIKEAPQDVELLRIATALYNLQRVNFYQLTASTKRRGHHYHSGCMDVTVDRADGKEMTRGTEDELTDILRSFADWIYSQLEAEYDYRMSDEAVDEGIICNDYEFTAEGEVV